MTKTVKARAPQTHKWFVELNNGQTMAGTASSAELAEKAMSSYRAKIERDAKRFPKDCCKVLGYGVNAK